MAVTRRSLVQMAAVLAVPAASAQTAGSGPAAAPSGDAQAVQAQLARNAQLLAQVKLPPETEPAFHFKA